jgi:hypothetical protein
MSSHSKIYLRRSRKVVVTFAAVQALVGNRLAGGPHLPSSPITLEGAPHLPEQMWVFSFAASRCPFRFYLHDSSFCGRRVAHPFISGQKYISVKTGLWVPHSSRSLRRVGGILPVQPNVVFGRSFWVKVYAGRTAPLKPKPGLNGPPVRGT